MEAMDRLKNAIEGVIVALVFCAIYWILGFLIYKTSGREIRTNTAYGACVILAFLAKRAFLIYWFQ